MNEFYRITAGLIFLGIFSQGNSADWSGEIPNGTVWPGGQVQRVTGDVTIAAGSTLTIQAGAIVKFNGGGDMFVDGNLVAGGTSGSPIYFTSDRDDTVGGDTNGDGTNTSPFAGAWNKVDISSSGSGDLDWVIIRYGGDRTFGVQGAIEVDEGSLNYNNGSINQSDSAGIRIWSANPIISDLDFSDNRNGGIQINLDANPAISGATFSDNGTNGVAVDGGSFTVNGVWNDPVAVYRLTGDVTVPAGLTLTVAAGQVIKMNSGVDLFVNGTLISNGSSGAHVTMTSDKDDSIGGDTNNDVDASTPFAGAWNKLDIGSTGNANMTWVDIAYGGDRTFGVQGALEVDQGSLTFTNGSVNWSDSAGIRMWSANPTLSGLAFDNNRNGGIQMNVDANPAVSNVSFSDNGTNGIAVDGGTLTVDGFWDDPGAVYRLTGDITIPDGRTLAVAAGQRVKLNSGVDVFIDGVMSVSGSTTNHVVFTSDRDDIVGGDTNNDADGSSPFVGAWNKLDIGPTGSADFAWVDIFYGGDRTFGVQGALEVDQGLLNFNGGSVNLSDSAGIRIWSATPTISGLSFDSNVYGGMQMNVDANPDVSNVSFSNNDTNGIAVDGGTLSIDGFWNDPDAVYRITGDITVPDGISLSVAADQIVKFNSGVDVFVNGSLIASGSNGSPISLTSDKDDSIGGDTNNDADGSTPFAGAWNKIDIGASGQGNFSWLNAYYGGDLTFGVQGTIEVDEGELSFSNGSVNSSDSAGIRIWSATPSIDGLRFEDNRYGGIQMNVDANPSVSNVSFANNGTNGVAVDGGTLTVPGHWDDPDAVYRITGDVTVPDGLSLTVAAGQVVKGNSGVDITVEGDFNAVGSAAAQINFSSDIDDSVGGDTNNDGTSSTPFAGSWNGFFVPDTGSADIRYASIRYAGDRTFGYAGSVHLDGGALDLANALIEHSDSAAVYAAGNSTATLANCILSKSLYGVRALSSSEASVINCTVDGNDAGAASTDAQLALTNNIISNNARVGIEQSGAASLVVQYNDVYNPTASQGNYSGLGDQTGVNGNLSSDPLLGNPAAGIFSLLSGSPAIDSGTSEGAPATDLINNPRIDDLGIENIGGGNPNYFDMGALERQKGSDPVDLVIDDIEFSPESGEIGDTVTISWTVRNAGTAPAAAPWTDAIFASNDQDWDIDDERLEIFEQALTLLPGESYTESVDVEIPPTLPGTLNFIIRADYRQQVREIAETNDELAAVDIEFLTIVPGESITFDLTDERQERYVRVDAPSDRAAFDLSIALDDSDDLGINSLHVSYQQIPTAEESDIRAVAGQADQLLSTGELLAGTYFVLAEGAALASSPSEITVSALSRGFGIDSISPENGGNQGNLTMLIEGAALTSDATVRLLDGSTVVRVADQVALQENTQLYATFDLTGLPVGDYEVEVEQLFVITDEDLVSSEQTLAARSPTPLSVTEGVGPELVLSLELPGAVRAGRSFEYTIRYTNEGDADASAPLIVVSASQGTGLVEPNATESGVVPILLMGIADEGPAYILRPGQSGALQVLGHAPTSADTLEIFADIGVDGSGGPAFSELIENLGGSVDSSFGMSALANLDAHFGSTWESYYSGMGALSSELALGNQRVSSVLELLTRAVSEPVPGLENKSDGPDWPIESNGKTGSRPEDVAIDDPRRTGTGPDSKPAPAGENGRSGNASINPYCEQNYLNSIEKYLLNLANNAPFTGNASSAAGDNLRMFVNGRQNLFTYDHSSSFSTRIGQRRAVGLTLHKRAWLSKAEEKIKQLVSQDALTENSPVDLEKIPPGFLKFSKLSDGIDIKLAIGGVRLESDAVMVVESRQSEGDLTTFDGYIEYTIKDFYDFQAKNFSRNFPSQVAYDLGWCADTPLGYEVHYKIRKAFSLTLRVPRVPVDPSPVTPPTRPGDQGSSNTRTSFDPNDKVGPATAGGSGHVFEGEPLDYTIFFENDPVFATAPAQEVVVIDDLDPDLDWETFELGVFAFGDTRIGTPPGSRSYSAEVNSVNPDGTPLLVRVSASVDLLLGRIVWSFESIDPETGGPPNGIETGFLPVNDATHQGEGHVTFSIYPRSDIAFGTELTNSAEIYFDFNDPITTPTTRHVLTDDSIFSSPFESQN